MSFGTGTVTVVDPELRAFLVRHYPPDDVKSDSTEPDRPFWLLGTGDVIPRFYGTPIGMRFELSGISGTYSAELDRVRTDDELSPIIAQAANRSIELFEAAFAEGETGWVFARTGFAQSLRERIGTFRLPSRRRAVAWLNEVMPVAAQQRLTVDAVPDWRWDEDGEPPMVLDASLAIAPRSVSYQEILHRIASAELGGDGKVWETYFISKDTGVVFHMYDDRGLDILAPNPDVIRPIYDRFNEWILDYDRDRIDAVFG